MRLVALLLAICSLLPLMALMAIGFGFWNIPWIIPVLATLITVVPAAMTLAVMVLLKDRSPEEKIVFSLVGTFLRIGLAGAGGFLAFISFDEIREKPLLFVSCSLAMYLISLIVEVAIGYRFIVADPAAKILVSDKP